MDKQKTKTKPFLKLTERAIAANYELSREAILLHEHLLSMGGPYLTSKSRLKVSFGTYETPLEELTLKGLVLIDGEDLLNPFYFIDTGSPKSDYHYKGAEIETASRLFVTKDLSISKQGNESATLAAFQEVWEARENHNKNEKTLRDIWSNHCRKNEGRYKEETREEMTKTKLDKTREKIEIEEIEGETSSLPFIPSSCSVEEDMPFLGELSPVSVPFDQKPQETTAMQIDLRVFVHEWKEAFHQNDEAKKSMLAKVYKQYPQEAQEQINAYLNEEECFELELPFI